MANEGYVRHVDVFEIRQIVDWAADLAGATCAVRAAPYVDSESVATAHCSRRRDDMVRSGFARTRQFGLNVVRFVSPTPQRIGLVFHQSVQYTRNGRTTRNPAPTVETGYWPWQRAEFPPRPSITTRRLDSEHVKTKVQDQTCAGAQAVLPFGINSPAAHRHAHSAPLERSLSAACGIAQNETDATRCGWKRRLDFFKLTSPAVEDGRPLVHAHRVPSRMNFHCAGAFAASIPGGAYDPSYWNNALHLISDATTALAWSKQTLADHGLLLDDYVSATRMQWSSVILDHASRLRAPLPAGHIGDPVNFSEILPAHVTRPSLTTLTGADHSECADSAQMLPSMHNWSSRVEIRLTGGSIYHCDINDISQNVVAADDSGLIDEIADLDADWAHRRSTH